MLDMAQLLRLWLERAACSAEAHSSLLLYFFSHTWERPHWCEHCETGLCGEAALAHPDDVDNSKAANLARHGHKVASVSGQQCYYWVDFGGIDQDNARAKCVGVNLLPLYVSCMGGMVMYEGRKSSRRYEPRAWTRVERMLAYSFSVDGNMIRLAHDDAPSLDELATEPGSAFVAVDEHGLRQSWPFKSAELPSVPTELRLGSDSQDYGVAISDPLKGSLTNPGERELMERLCEIAEQVQPASLDGNKPPLVLGETVMPLWDPDRDYTKMHRGGKFSPLHVDTPEACCQIS